MDGLKGVMLAQTKEQRMGGACQKKAIGLKRTGPTGLKQLPRVQFVVSLLELGFVCYERRSSSFVFLRLLKQTSEFSLRPRPSSAIAISSSPWIYSSGGLQGIDFRLYRVRVSSFFTSCIFTFHCVLILSVVVVSVKGKKEGIYTFGGDE